MFLTKLFFVTLLALMAISLGDTAPCGRSRRDSWLRSRYTEEYCRQLLQSINNFYNEDGTQKPVESRSQSLVNSRLRSIRRKFILCTEFYGITEPARNPSPQNRGPSDAPAGTPPTAQLRSPRRASTAALSSDISEGSEPEGTEVEEQTTQPATQPASPSTGRPSTSAPGGPNGAPASTPSSTAQTPVPSSVSQATQPATQPASPPTA